MPEYAGGSLYPSGKKYPGDSAVKPDFSFNFSVNWEKLKAKWQPGARALEEEISLVSCAVGPPHNVGGDGYTHSIPRYDRIVREGLETYEKRVLLLEAGDCREGLLEILEGIKIYHRRGLELLRAVHSPEKLIAALEQVPFRQARNLYEALVCWNFIYYIDGCDNPGRLDADLEDFYDSQDYTGLLAEFFRNVDCNDGWSAAIGPRCGDLTLQCLKAVKGLRRPSLELRVTRETPDSIWQAAAEALASGCGQPALYNEELYRQSLAGRFPEIPAEDLFRFNGGGCTESMLAGISNVGSLDAGVNILAVFEPYMQRALETSGSFEVFYQGFMDSISAEILETLDRVSAYQKRRAEYRPHPLRSLLVDDCIDKGKDFNACGARYYWSVINIAGLVNVIDSLLAVRHLVYETGKYSPRAFLDALAKQDSLFIASLRKCPCFGVDNDDADKLAADCAGKIFDMFERKKPWLGGQFLPSSIQFTTYADAGKNIGPTPDGRDAGSPLADSLGAIHGKDTAGPTALLNSAAKLPLWKAAGTPVLNLRLRKELVLSALKPLVMGYFRQGGMQIQISCLSREDILDAMEHPEKHKNLIVRIGGFSEYFNNLSRELKETVLRRTEHE
jgi:formate C-acetyltransferase